MLGGQPDTCTSPLDGLLQAIDDAVHAGRVEKAVHSIKQIDGIVVHCNLKRSISSQTIRMHLLQKVIGVSDGDHLVRLVNACSALCRHDLDSVFAELVREVESIGHVHLPGYACALLAESRRSKHVKLRTLISAIDARIATVDLHCEEQVKSAQDLVTCLRIAIKRDSKAGAELCKAARCMSVLGLLCVANKSTTALKTCHEQYLLDCTALTRFGLGRLGAKFCDYLERVAVLTDEHDEAGILLLLTQSLDMDLSQECRVALLRGLLQKKGRSRQAVIDRLLWPVKEAHYLVAQGLGVDVEGDFCRNARLLVDIGRQDALPAIIKTMSVKSIMGLLHTNSLTHPWVYAELLARNERAITDSVQDTHELVSDKTELLFQLILKRVQNHQFAEHCIARFFRQSGSGQPERVSWLGICGQFDYHPFFLLGVALAQRDSLLAYPQLVSSLDVLCEFLTCHAEYPNDPVKLTTILSAFTMSIEYCIQCCAHKSELQLRHTIGKLVKRRTVLQGKVGVQFRDFVLSDDCLARLGHHDGTDSLLQEQFNVAARRVDRQTYERSSVGVKKAILRHAQPVGWQVSCFTCSDVDLLISELEGAVKSQQGVENADHSFIKQIECPPAGKAKKIVECGAVLFRGPFVDDLIHDVLEVCGKIEDESGDASLSGVKRFESLSTERNMPAILGALIGFFEETTRMASLLLKHMARTGHSKAIMDALPVGLLFAAKKLTLLCRAALEGSGWEKMQGLLLSFYSTSVSYLRAVLKSSPASLSVDFVVSVSNGLTRAVYLLIPVAHQLDHDKMKAVYELGKGKLKEAADRTGKASASIDSKISREALRLPRLIFLIETFDCLVVKLSQWHPGLAANIYRSTSRDFRIQVDQIEAVLAQDPASDDIQSGLDE